MSGVRFAITTGEVQTGIVPKTHLQMIAAANHRAHIKEINVSAKGTVSTDQPMLLEVLRQTSAGSMTTITPVKWNASDDESLQITAAKDAGTEPSDSNEVVLSQEVHPQGGVYDWVSPHGWEYPLCGGQRLGIRITAAVDIKAVTSVLGDE